MSQAALPELVPAASDPLAIADASASHPPGASTADQTPARKPAARLATLRARRILDLLGVRVGPGAAAGAIAALHASDPWLGVIVAVAVAASLSVLGSSRLPLHLMPLGRPALAIVLPAAGLAAIATGAAALGAQVPLHAFLAAVVGAWATLAVGAWTKERFEREREVALAVIGSPSLAAALAEEIAAAGIRGYRVVGWITPNDANDGAARCLGSLREIRALVQSHRIDLLLHASPGRDSEGAGSVSRLEVFERVAEQCLDLPVRMMEMGSCYEEMLGHVPIGQINAAWFQYILHPRFEGSSAVSKRAFDVVAAAATATLVAPVVAIAALAVKISDGGPILYRQRRTGEGGRDFEILKLRTMRVAAESESPRWASKNDSRVTPVGRFLRRTHIDELPQLWNVLRGEMTLVGPRPEQPGIVAVLQQDFSFYDPRHTVKPGITGWAQVCCGYAGTPRGTAFKLCHDLYYLKHRSLIFDLLICVETLRVAAQAARFEVATPGDGFIGEPAIALESV